MNFKKMSSENGKRLPETDAGGLNFEATELTLGLPGESRVNSDGGARPSSKRGFRETVDLSLGDNIETNKLGRSQIDAGEAAKSHVSKAPVVGWPPGRGHAKRAKKSCKYVKMAVDGAPYLRKVDIEMYNSYQQLLTSLEDMFSRFTIRNYWNEKKMDQTNGIEYVSTYEDKDGDWMLVGDVPWPMFVESCKRLRLMKSTEAVGLAPRTPPECLSRGQIKQTYK